MNLFGIGPALALTGALGFALAKWLDGAFGIRYGFAGLGLAAATLAAFLLMTAGLYLWLGAIVELRRGEFGRKLLAEGVYARTQNPMYAAFIFFLAPALALLLNNLVYLTASALMYAVFDWLIEREEKPLLEKFGQAYLDYAASTPHLIPRLFTPRK